MKTKLTILILFLIILDVSGQSPHGIDFKMDCSLCHSIYDWRVEADTISFNHSETDFELTGQHFKVDCKSCHSNLIFDDAENKCISCHVDIHEQSVGLDCAQCHNTESWIVSNIFDIHRETRFPLLGKHETTDCVQCHATSTNLRFDPLSIECYSCHSTDYLTVKNPDHKASGFSTACEDCHEVSRFEWTFTAFGHDFFPLVEGHHIPNCYKCHSTTTYKGLSPVCSNCHMSDYNNSSNPSHLSLGFSTDCNDCHTLSLGWTPANFREHDNTSFPIYSGEHRGEWNSCSTCHTDRNNYSIFTCTDCHEHNQNSMNDEHSGINGYSYQSTACYSCHPRGNEDGAFNHSSTDFPLIGAHTVPDCSDCHSTQTTPSMDCESCHKSEYTNTQNPDHEQIGISPVCEDCHDSFAWVPTLFSHSSTGFALLGKHSSLICQDCHTNSDKLSQDCFECHTEDFNNAPNHLSQNYPTDCEMCHNSNLWSETIFNHASTEFPLLGIHSTTDCASCHTTGYSGTSKLCYDCHQSDYEQSVNPNHSAIGLETTCENCHDSFAWAPSSFSHSSTGFELLGKHSSLDCQNCHTSPDEELSQNCYDCHIEDFNSAPDHLSQSFPTDCEMCHNSNLWSETIFNHASSEFPLLGVHSTTDCASCHTTGYSGTSKLCYDCHQSDYEQSVNPNHSAIGLETTCENCHDSFAWAPSSFSHSSTGFELLGKHSSLGCQNCHTSPDEELSQNCYDCHTEEFNNAPSHLSQNYPTDCEMCHNSNLWSETIFNHTSTEFPLLGVHSTTDCASCHTTGYSGTSKLCYDCHQSDYEQSVNPNHSAIGLETTCENCHDSFAWAPSSFSHSSTGFELLGKHSSLGCQNCHTSPDEELSQNCYDCHIEDFNSAPDHLSQSYPTDCEMCHNSNLWSETSFNHSSTEFPLTGAHTNTSCLDCHGNGYVNTPMDCNSCHNSDYNFTTDPNHVNLALSLQCQNCHSTTPGWSPASFPVHDNFYLLLGAHANIKDNCTDCHSSGYTNTPNTCFGCHQSDYNNTTDPNHSVSGFSTDCESCHSQSAWDPSTFDHDKQYFPIYSGEHRGEWDACSDCHEVQSNYAIFTCISCHEHNRTEMDDEHRGVNGYSYVSTACYDCHPNGNEDGLITISAHDNSLFKLFGGHNELSCKDCHNELNNPGQAKCISCHEHSIVRTQKIHIGVKHFIHKDFACIDCHQTGKAIKSFEEQD